MRGSDFHLPRPVRRLLVLLEFHPWMLALVVFLACAVGVAIMEQLRERPPMVAQASVQHHQVSR